VRRLRDLDPEEWELVWSRYSGAICAYVARLVPDAGACEDIRQETFLAAWLAIGHFDEACTFEQYMFPIARHRAIDYLRHRRPESIAMLPGQERWPRGVCEPARRDAADELAAKLECERQVSSAFADASRTWVNEARSKGQWLHLMVVESLIVGGWQNRDSRARFGVWSNEALAGIKFRALQRMGEIVRERAANEAPRTWITQDIAGLDLDLARIWRERRVACPSSEALEAFRTGGLAQGERESIRFHALEMSCPSCAAETSSSRESTHVSNSSGGSRPAG